MTNVEKDKKIAINDIIELLYKLNSIVDSKMELRIRNELKNESILDIKDRIIRLENRLIINNSSKLKNDINRMVSDKGFMSNTPLD